MKFIKKITALLLVASILCFQVPANITSADEAAVTSTCAHRLGSLPPSDVVGSTSTHIVYYNGGFVTCTISHHVVRSVQQCMICYAKFYGEPEGYVTHSVDHVR